MQSFWRNAGNFCRLCILWGLEEGKSLTTGRMKATSLRGNARPEPPVAHEGCFPHVRLHSASIRNFTTGRPVDLEPIPREFGFAGTASVWSWSTQSLGPPASTQMHSRLGFRLHAPIACRRHRLVALLDSARGSWHGYSPDERCGNAQWGAF